MYMMYISTCPIVCVCFCWFQLRHPCHPAIQRPEALPPASVASFDALPPGESEAGFLASESANLPEKTNIEWGLEILDEYIYIYITT